MEEGDIETALRVLLALEADETLYNAKAAPMKQLRKVIHRLGVRQTAKAYDGLTPAEYKERRAEKKEKQARLNRQKAQDRKLIETRNLRLARRLQLQALTEGQDELPMIPDGAVDDGFNTSIGQSGGTEQVPVVVLDKGGKQLMVETEEEPELNRPQSCYACKARFYKLHHFYATFCPTCAKTNWEKRHQAADLKGKVALVTGARVKIGYQITLKLLRMGATVLATTRFPADAALRYSKEKDFGSWKERLKLCQLDFKAIGLVEDFATKLGKGLLGVDRLDIIINNACQTIQRPQAYYRHLLETEESFRNGQHTLGDAHTLLLTHSNSPEHVSTVESNNEEESAKYFPIGVYDVNAQQVDLRDTNSWLLKMEEVSTSELVEVLAVNTVAPFILNSKLKPLMVKTREMDSTAGAVDTGSYIINVSAMEGKFYRFKNANHPHTNMAKASLNMMTRTSASDYAKSGIYMNSVDTGWINDENPLAQASRIAKDNKFQTPIDEVDAAARILDPIITGFTDNTKRVFGLFLKDYRPTEW